MTVHLRDGACLLKSLEIKAGERRDFGFVHLRADEFVRRLLIGVWAAGVKEVWWLATDLPNSVSKIASYYDRRMGLEEQFRDAKGVRFGVKLKWTQFTKPEFVARMYLLVGLALLLWTSVGQAGTVQAPKGAAAEQDERSAAVVGTHRLLLLAQDARQFKLTVSFVRAHLPPPGLRAFKWLTAPQK